MNSVFKYSLVNAFSTALYVSAVGSFLFYAPEIFGKIEMKTAIIPFVMLMLLVFSVAVTGVLVFGRSFIWYLEGKKKDAVTLLFSTLAIFFLIMVTVTLFLGYTLSRY